MLVIDRDGRKGLRQYAGAAPGFDQQSTVNALQQPTDRTELRARATVFDVTVTAPFDGSAIKAVIEHSFGLAIDVLVPYRADATDVEIDADAADAVWGRRQLWA